MAKKKSLNNKAKGLNQMRNDSIIIRKVTILESIPVVSIQKKANRQKNRTENKTCKMEEKSDPEKQGCYY